MRQCHFPPFDILPYMTYQFGVLVIKELISEIIRKVIVFNSVRIYIIIILYD